MKTLAGLGILVLAISAPCLADDWNSGTGGKPSRHSLSTERGPIAAGILWQGGIPAIIAQPAVIEGNIVAMSRIQDLSDVLHGTLIVAHDLHTGDTLWTRDLPVDFPATDWRNRVTAIRDGKVYATRSGNTNYSYLYALNATNGTTLWRSQDSIDESSTESVSFAQNGDLIVGNFTSLTRINGTDGTRTWRTSRSSPTSGGSEVAVSGNMGYAWEASPQGPRISAFNLSTGARLYSSPGIGGGFIQQVGPFVGPDGTVYAPRTQNNVTTDYLVAFSDIDTALVEKWRVPLGYVPFGSFGVGPEGSVYSYTVGREVIRIDSENGSIIDTSTSITTDFFQPRIAIDSTGIIYLTNGGFSEGALYSFNPDLSLRWTEQIASVNIGGPAIGDDGIMVVCGIGTNVRAYRSPPTGVDEGKFNRETLALSGELLQNYPNPFNPSTTITYKIARVGLVSLSVYNILGQEVATLFNEEMGPGTYTVVFSGNELASGTYFCRLWTSGYESTKRLVLLK